MAASLYVNWLRRNPMPVKGWRTNCMYPPRECSIGSVFLRGLLHQPISPLASSPSPGIGSKKAFQWNATTSFFSLYRDVFFFHPKETIPSRNVCLQLLSVTFPLPFCVASLTTKLVFRKRTLWPFRPAWRETSPTTHATLWRVKSLSASLRYRNWDTHVHLFFLVSMLDGHVHLSGLPPDGSSRIFWSNRSTTTFLQCCRAISCSRLWSSIPDALMCWLTQISSAHFKLTLRIHLRHVNHRRHPSQLLTPLRHALHVLTCNLLTNGFTLAHLALFV